MIKIWTDGDYQDLTEEQYREQFGGGADTETLQIKPTTEDRLTALEAAVADLALMSVQENS